MSSGTFSLRIYRDAPVPSDLAGCVIALGNFDGLHQGHKAVIQQAVHQARLVGKPAVVMTFEPHPKRVFQPQTPLMPLLRLRKKAELLASWGVDALRMVRFTPAFARTPAEAFVEELLSKQLRVSHVVTGEDFVFGHNRGGNVTTLKQLGKKYGFGTSACEPVMVASARCSSTRIRGLLAVGNVREAAQLLGRPYSIAGCVRSGDKRGRELSFPTANMLMGGVFTPAYGVYAVRMALDGIVWPGVANLGLRPTFDGKQPQLETHLFDFNRDLYGRRVEVMFTHFLRPERKFASVDALKEQIAKDSITAQSLLAGG